MENKDKLFEAFTAEMFKMQVVDFIGLAKILGVEIADREQDKLRPMEDIVAGILNGFTELSNTKKKEILKLCKQANKNKRGNYNGNRTKNSQQQDS